MYLRQSKARDDSISIELQREACFRHAAQRGYDVVGEWADEGVSAFRAWERRPAFPGLVEAAAAGEVDVVLVYRWSRLSRSRKDQYAVIFMLEDAGAAVESANENFDAGTASGRFGRGMMMELAAFESDLKSEQFKEAHRRRLDRGLPTHGHDRFGYEADRDAQGRTSGFHPHPETGPVLREMYLRYTSGSSYRGIAVWLDARGLRTVRGRRWTNQSVKVTLDSGFGAGLLATGVRSVAPRMLPGAHDGVIDAAEWAAYLRAVETRAPAPRGRPTRHYLTRLLRCGLCSGSMSSQVSHTRGVRYDSVRCSLHTVHPQDCPGLSVNRDWVQLKLAVWLSDHDERVAAALERDPGERLRGARSRREASAIDLAGIDTRLARLASGWASGLLDDAGYSIARAEADAERRSALDAMAEAEEDERRLEAGLGGGWDALFEQEAGSWNHEEITARLARVIDRIEVHRDRVVCIPHIGEARTWIRAWKSK